MIAESLAAFLNALATLNFGGFGYGGFGDGGFGGNTQFPGSLDGFGIKGAFVMSADLMTSELVAPYILITEIGEGPQELWEIGDTKRKENPMVSISFYGTSHAQRRDVMARLRWIMESTKAYENDGETLHPGIDFLAAADLLRTTDNLIYYSDQPEWGEAVTPAIYKNEDSNGEPVVVSSGFTIDKTLGTVTFDAELQDSDKVRASYKIGVIDFDIAGVSNSHQVDLDGNPARYLGIMDLSTHFYVKTTANRWL